MIINITYVYDIVFLENHIKQHLCYAPVCQLKYYNLFNSEYNYYIYSL